jgi:hypothetical protein
VEPAGAAKFNIPRQEELHTRKVKLSQPGRYRVRAESHSWGGKTVDSNIVEVIVVER